MREIHTAIAALDAALNDLGGCTDGGCIIVKPKGMHTNGGCRCSTNRLKMERFAYEHNRFTDAVRAAAAPTPAKGLKAGHDFPCAIWAGPKGACNERNCKCY